MQLRSIQTYLQYKDKMDIVSAFFIKQLIKYAMYFTTIFKTWNIY